jgi:restriction system protein
MTRLYHYHHAKHGSKSERHAAFPIIILLVCLVWAHKAALTRIEHLWLVIGVTVAVIVGLVVIAKLGIKISRYRRLRSLDMMMVDSMTGLEFEKYVARLLKARGYGHIRLTEHYDLGVDIIAENEGIRYGIQVKRYSGLVKAEAVRQVVTALKHYNCDRAMVITNSTFSHTAKRLADSNNCLLIDRDELALWINRANKKEPF